MPCFDDRTNISTMRVEVPATRGRQVELRSITTPKHCSRRLRVVCEPILGGGPVREAIALVALGVRGRVRSAGVERR